MGVVFELVQRSITSHNYYNICYSISATYLPKQEIMSRTVAVTFIMDIAISFEDFRNLFASHSSLRAAYCDEEKTVLAKASDSQIVVMFFNIDLAQHFARKYFSTIVV